MTQKNHRLTALSFHKVSKHPSIINFEEVFLYSLLAKLQLCHDIAIRDLATQGEKVALPTQLTHNQAIQELQKISKSTQARFVLTGTLAPAPENYLGGDPSQGSEAMPIHSLSLTVRLFESQDNLYALDKVYTFYNTSSSETDSEADISLKTLSLEAEVDMSCFNRLLDQVFEDILLLVLPGQATTLIRELVGKPIGRSYQALNYMVQAQHKNTNPEKLTFMEAAVKADPKFETGYAQIAKLHRLERHYEKSVFYYRKALEVSNSTALTKAIYATDAGIGCALLGKNDLALQWWQCAIQLFPGYINPYFNIANLYEDQEQFEQAAHFFQKAQELAPNDFRTFYSLARIYSKMNIWDKAIDQYNRWIAQEGNDPWCHSDIATCYLNLGDLQNAAKHFEQTVSLDPDGEAGDYAKLILAGISG